MEDNEGMSALKAMFQKQHYHLVGNHSGVKLCHWMRQKLLYGRVCYKEQFYGIECHRCMQMTPTINQCTQNCLFCWRYQGNTETELKEYDSPEKVLEGCIRGQRMLLMGFKGDRRCNIPSWKEAQEPNQVAISLSGEPTLYPELGALIELCHKRRMRTFLVSNGTNPKKLEEFDPLPTQLYVTVAAPNEELFNKLCVPIVPDAWKRLNQTLELLPSLKTGTRVVLRHTLVENWNIGQIEEYAKLDEKAEPMFIEPKGYMFVGQSRQRMSISNMPSHQRVREFGKELGDLLSYEILDESAGSRVVLLGKEKERQRIC